MPAELTGSSGSCSKKSSDPAYVVDPVRDRLLANDAGCAILGYAREELLATPVSHIHPQVIPIEMIREDMRYIELSHEISDGMPVFPGLERPRITAFLDHERSRPLYDGLAEFYISRLELVGNTGTYLDSPFHRYRDGRDLSAIGLEEVAGLPGLVLDGEVAPNRAVSVHGDQSQLAGKAVLVRTGWDVRWGTDAYWEPGPFISPETLELLLRGQPRLVGVDFWNVDDTNDPSRRVHTRLLAEDILIVEHLRNLDALPAQGLRFFAVPLRIVTGASVPVRAFAELPADDAP